MARSRGFRSIPRSKRLTEWVPGPEDVDGNFTASTQALWSAGVQGMPGGPLTIIRTRGLFAAYLIATTTVGTGFFGAAGIGIVSNEAFAVGASAVPGPLSEDDWDGWLWHHHFDVRAITGTIADGVNAVSMVERIVIDSKAMRKWDSDSETLVGVTEVVESVAGTLEVQASTRLLIKT